MSFYTFDEIEVGRSLPSREYEVQSEQVDEYRRALGLGTSEAATVPAMFCVMLLKDMRTLLPAPPGGIHAAQTFEFFEGMRIGDAVTVTSRVVEKIVRHGRRNVIVATEFRRHDDVLLARGTARRIWAQ